MTVLIISAPRDVHAQAVMACLGKRGIAVEMLDLSEFPTQLCLSMEYSAGKRRFWLKRKAGDDLDLSTITAVWWRRPQAFILDPALADPAAQRFAISESATVFQGLYVSMAALWINPPDRDIVAGHKPFQLTLAQQLGLTIPETLITNDPGEARRFWAKYPGDVIHKQFVPLPESWRETRRLTPEDEGKIDAVRHTPVLFQKHVGAAAEVRAILIGDDIFAGITQMDKAVFPQDIRMNPDAQYVPHDLPQDIRQKLLQLARRLGLVYGAVDLLLTPQGKYIFLEINPAGQFLYIEKTTGLPIADALAARLAPG